MLDYGELYAERLFPFIFGEASKYEPISTLLQVSDEGRVPFCVGRGMNPQTEGPHMLSIGWHLPVPYCVITSNCDIPTSVGLLFDSPSKWVDRDRLVAVVLQCELDCLDSVISRFDDELGWLNC